MRDHQVIFALPPENGVDYTMRIFNSDGSEPEMCGNGIRCLARFVAEKDGSGPVTQRIDTLAGMCHACISLRLSLRHRPRTWLVAWSMPTAGAPYAWTRDCSDPNLPPGTDPLG